jgi:hypothetical protein
MHHGTVAAGLKPASPEGTEMTTLVNRFNAQPGKEAELLTTAKGWKDVILANPDCSSFDVFTDQDSPASVVLIEESMKLMTGMPEGTYLDHA